MNPSVTAAPCQLPLAREPLGCSDEAPLAIVGVVWRSQTGGIPQAGRFPHRFALSRSTNCESLSQKSKIFASSLWQGSLWGAAMKPPLPKGGGLAKPNRGDSAGKACGTSYLFPLHYSLKTFPFPHRFVLSRSTNCESLSHGYAVPAPFSKGAFGVQRRSPPGHCGGGLAKPNRGDSPGWQVSI